MFDVYMIENDALLVGRLKGVLNADFARRIVEFIEIKEAEIESGFNRFCDLSRLAAIELSADEMLEVTLRRAAYNPNDVRVKSAFLATQPLAYGIARMYEQLLHSTRIEVRVFDSLEAAAAWLGVKPEKLTL